MSAAHAHHVRKTQDWWAVIVIRCTHKLLDRIGEPADADPPESTSALGDWYAKPFQSGPKRFVLLMSGTTRLPVVVPGRDLANLGINFPEALRSVLIAIGAPQAIADAEVGLSRDFAYAATDSRSMLGSLNDFASMGQHRSRGIVDVDTVALSVDLSGTPIIAMNFGFPRQVALNTLGTQR